MKFSTILLGVALYLLSPVSAGITINTPFATVSWEGGDDEDIIWSDDGKAPKLADLGITTIDLMMGNSTDQIFIANIAKVPATAKKVEYHVPETVGPISNDYLIKFTAGTYTALSGSFRIEDVYGKAPAAPAAPSTDPAAPPKAPIATDPKSADPKTVAGDPKAVVPTPKSSAASNLFPGFSGVAAAAVAFAFI